PRLSMHLVLGPRSLLFWSVGPLLVRRQWLHRARIDRHLYFVAIRRRHEQYPHSWERIHERQVAESPDAEQPRSYPDFPDAERDAGEHAVDRWVNLEVAGQPQSYYGAAREQDKRRQKYFRGAREQTEEREHEHQTHRKQCRNAPALNEAEVHPVRLFAHVAVPDHEVLAESDVSPERGESEAEFAKVVEVLVLNHV